MIYLLTYGTRQFNKSKRTLCASALKHGADRTVSLSPSSIRKTEFYKTNRLTFQIARGAGQWLWKPYIIAEQLKKISENDFLIYSDAGIEIIADLNYLIRLCAKSEKQILLFNSHNKPLKATTKRDCFILMDADTDFFYEQQECMGGFIVMKKNSFTTSFVNEWLNYATDPRILTDQPNTCGKENFASFNGHRHDQSILSILAIRYGLKFYRNPTQWGNFLKEEKYRIPEEFVHLEYSSVPDMDSSYPTILFIHRRRNYDIFHRLQSKLNSIRQNFKSC
jgi:hypothetical protein